MTGLPLAQLKQSPDSFDGIHLELRGQLVARSVGDIAVAARLDKRQFSLSPATVESLKAQRESTHIPE